MVRAAIITSIIWRSIIKGIRPLTKSRMIKANAAALDPTARWAVIGVGAPSYTSGAHIWKGTAATLNPSPAIKNKNPINNPGLIELELLVQNLLVEWL